MVKQVTLCVQCSMRALLTGQMSPTFDESPEEHIRRVHPDPVATAAERVEMEKALRERGKED